MQTFMPYSDFVKVAQCLDYKRLGKQRVETWQIYKALTQENYGWKNHPIVKMWKGYETGLLQYGIIMCQEWKSRGYKDTMLERFKSEQLNKNTIPIYPSWINDIELHKSHQSNLIRKYPLHYRRFFPDIPDNLEYKWVI